MSHSKEARKRDIVYDPSEALRNSKRSRRAAGIYRGAAGTTDTDTSGSVYVAQLLDPVNVSNVAVPDDLPDPVVEELVRSTMTIKSNSASASGLQNLLCLAFPARPQVAAMIAYVVEYDPALGVDNKFFIIAGGHSMVPGKDVGSTFTKGRVKAFQSMISKATTASFKISGTYSAVVLPDIQALVTQPAALSPLGYTDRDGIDQVSIDHTGLTVSGPEVLTSRLRPLASNSVVREDSIRAFARCSHIFNAPADGSGVYYLLFNGRDMATEDMLAYGKTSGTVFYATLPRAAPGETVDVTIFNRLFEKKGSGNTKYTCDAVWLGSNLDGTIQKQNAVTVLRTPIYSTYETTNVSRTFHLAPPKMLDKDGNRILYPTLGSISFGASLYEDKLSYDNFEAVVDYNGHYMHGMQGPAHVFRIDDFGPNQQFSYSYAARYDLIGKTEIGQFLKPEGHMTSETPHQLNYIKQAFNSPQGKLKRVYVSDGDQEKLAQVAAVATPLIMEESRVAASPIGKALLGGASGALEGLLSGGPIGALTGGLSGALGGFFGAGEHPPLEPGGGSSLPRITVKARKSREEEPEELFPMSDAEGYETAQSDDEDTTAAI